MPALARILPSQRVKRILVRCAGIMLIAELTAAQAIGINFPPETDSLAAAIWRLGLMSPESINGAAKLLGTPDLVPIVLSKLDTDGDGLTFTEVLSADLLAVARAVRKELRTQTTNPGKVREARVGSDKDIQAIVDDAQARLAASLDLGMPFEELPHVKIGQDPRNVPPDAFLASVPRPTADASLRYLGQFVNELNLVTDFVSKDAGLNAEYKRMLTENAAHMLMALGAGQPGIVEEQLVMMRRHVAANQSNSDERWIRGRRALRILDQINVTLGLLGSPAALDQL